MILRLKLGQDFKSKGHHPLHPVTHPIFAPKPKEQYHDRRRDSFPIFRGNEVSPHSARLFKFLHCWIVRGWRVRQYLEESGCQGHIKVVEANSCDGQICGLSSRSSIGRPLAHIMSSQMMADCGWLDPWQQQRRNAECSNGRGPVSRKRWGSGTYMSYMCHKYVIYMSYRSYIRIKWNI